MWTLDVLAFFEVSLQVHGEQRGTGGVVGASHRPVVAAGLVLSANGRRVGMKRAEETFYSGEMFPK